ncbi:MAG TPA: hypothetical protein VK721_05765 [Solirubrobacteraceae bacterium]|nr:hypothetical protein [Solirubrobacteraceae bacterium]
MMRRPLTTLALVATCGLLALGAIALASGRSAGSETARARQAGVAMRAWRLGLSAAPGDLALAEISFANADGTRLERRSLQVAVSGPFGDDYLATAVLHPATKRGPAALVLLVNRPSPLLDPVAVALRISARRSLGAPTVRRLANPFARPAGAPAPSLCDRQRHAALSASSLSVLGTRGSTLEGFGAAGAVAQAYDAACGLPYASSFKQAVERSGAPGQEAPTPAEPVSPTPPATPTPGPPVGKIPGEGCRPAAGRACPGAVAGAAPRAAAGAH